MGTGFEARYELLKLLGAGSTGEVHLARDKLAGTQVAIKFLITGPGPIPQAVERFLQEAEILRELRNPHVVRVEGGGVHEGRPYMVMEYVEGRDLGVRIEESGSYRLEEGCRLLAGIADGLAAIHSRGVLHRDLKPGNVLIDGHGRPRIGDLGLARRLGESGVRTRSGLVLGTPGFLAPELLRGETPVAANDIYSLGILAYYVVTGRLPFAATTPGEILVEQSRGMPVRTGPELPPRLLGPVGEMTHLDPDRRPEAATVRDWFEALAGGGPAPLGRSSAAVVDSQVEVPTRAVTGDQIRGRATVASQVGMPAKGRSAAPSVPQAGMGAGTRRLVAAAFLACSALVGAVALGVFGGGRGDPAVSGPGPGAAGPPGGQALEDRLDELSDRLEGFRLQPLVERALTLRDGSGPIAYQHAEDPSWDPEVRRLLQEGIGREDWFQAYQELAGILSPGVWTSLPSEPDEARTARRRRRRLARRLVDLDRLVALDRGLGGDGSLVPGLGDLLSPVLRRQELREAGDRADRLAGTRPLVEGCFYMTDQPQNPLLQQRILGMATMLGDASLKFCVGLDTATMHETREAELPPLDEAFAAVIPAVHELTPLAFLELEVLGEKGAVLADALVHTPRLERAFRTEFTSFIDWHCLPVRISFSKVLLGDEARRVVIRYRDLSTPTHGDRSPHWCLVAGVSFSQHP